MRDPTGPQGGRADNTTFCESSRLQNGFPISSTTSRTMILCIKAMPCNLHIRQHSAFSSAKIKKINFVESFSVPKWLGRRSMAQQLVRLDRSDYMSGVCTASGSSCLMQSPSKSYFRGLRRAPFLRSSIFGPAYLLMG